MVLNRYFRSSSFRRHLKTRFFLDPLAEGEKKAKKNLKGKQCTFYAILKKTMLFKRKKAACLSHFMS